MTTTHLSAIAHHVRPHATEAPALVIEQNLRNAAVEFCETTRLWRHEATQALTANHVPFDVPAHATVFEVEEAWFGDTQLTAMNYKGLSPTQRASTGNPHSFYQKTLGTVSLYPYSDGDLTFTAYLKPKEGGTYGDATYGDGPLQKSHDRLPTEIVDAYAETIAYGALARILVIPKQPFSNPQMAAAYSAMFDGKCREVAATQFTGQQRAAQRSKTEWF